MSKLYPITYEETAADHLSELLTVEEMCFRPDQIHRRKLNNYFNAPVGFCLGAYLANRVVGYALLVFSPNKKTVTIHSLAIHPKLRQKNIGFNLLQKTLMEVSKLGASQIFCDISSNNYEGYDLFAKAGFNVSIDEPVLLPNSFFGLRMQRKLAGDESYSGQHEIALNERKAEYFNLLRAQA